SSLPLSLLLPPAPADTYTLSLHDALPISLVFLGIGIWRFALHIDVLAVALFVAAGAHLAGAVLSFYAIGFPMMLAELFPHVYELDRKSTRLNSSHVSISYAVFCLKKKTDT